MTKQQLAMLLFIVLAEACAMLALYTRWYYLFLGTLLFGILCVRASQ